MSFCNLFYSNLVKVYIRFIYGSCHRPTNTFLRHVFVTKLSEYRGMQTWFLLHSWDWHFI